MRTLRTVLHLGQDDWPVYETTPDDPLWEEYGDCEGITLKAEREIHLLSTLPRRAMDPVLRHEVIHAALFQAGLDTMSGPREESFAVGLAAALGGLIRFGRVRR